MQPLEINHTRVYFFKRVPKDRKLPFANGMNSWKAEKPIMSQAEGTPSEGAETTGEVKSS